MSFNVTKTTNAIVTTCGGCSFYKPIARTLTLRMQETFGAAEIVHRLCGDCARLLGKQLHTPKNWKPRP